MPASRSDALLGAAILAARGVGLVPTLEAGVRAMVRIDRRFEPAPGGDEEERRILRAGWRRAVERSLRWAGPEAP